MASGKTIVLITGGNSGIGYETVAALSSASADFHILLGCRSVEKGEAAVEQMKKEFGSALKGTIQVIQIDITDRKSINTLKEKIETQFGRLDALINNGGVLVHTPMDILDALRISFETNPYIIYVSSEQGSVTQRNDPNVDIMHRRLRGEPYRMSKAAINMLSACHRYNYAEWGCRVLAFNPGWCVSNLTGAEGREMRLKAGARDPKEPAHALASIIQGKRDADIEKNGMVDVDEGVLPW
ncbi:(+)-neomenthol dehydrogenase [Daldinia childiae]|uniref:(+)-neomenthol dehydrogenase n=1 Tax=Daldinia childiae TaxID=326645 RepID=UPI001447D311|nr:(+)-neomenthol dehydrogenase [Daldinia childiae]KAF3058490.1 (+)-neomenthol dehydrogenase [Daldinia childiae]